MFVTSISQFMALNRPQEHGSNVQPPNHLTFVLKLEMQNAYKYLFIFRSFNHLTFTRPGLSFAVHQTCQFMNQSTQYHLIAAKSIFNRFCLGLSFALARSFCIYRRRLAQESHWLALNHRLCHFLSQHSCYLVCKEISNRNLLFNRSWIWNFGNIG